MILNDIVISQLIVS